MRNIVTNVIQKRMSRHERVGQSWVDKPPYDKPRVNTRGQDVEGWANPYPTSHICKSQVTSPSPDWDGQIGDTKAVGSGLQPVTALLDLT